jgi:hypothetical protein
MDMSQDIIDRYQSPNGDLYQKLVNQYGPSKANYISLAAASGERTQLLSAVEFVRNGAPPSDTGTLGIFINQMVTDPLDAPLESLNTTLVNSYWAFLKRPVVLITGGIILFFLLGGWKVLQAKTAKL